MSLRIGVQMDPLENVDINGDTTFRLMLEAQARGYSLFVYEPHALNYVPGGLTAFGRDVTVQREAGHHFTVLGEREADLKADLDVILLRQDPPFDMAYITTTHMLESIHPETYVVSDPAAVRNAPEKWLVTQFPDLTPPTLITRDPTAIHRFRDKHGDVIIKPLYGAGGAGVFRSGPNDENINALLELFSQTMREPFVVQAYLKAVRAGDKRVLLIEGEPVGAINRVPAEGDARSNMHVGGRAEPIALDDRDKEICAAIGPVLRERGLIFAGIDVIGGYLTEINVTSPTGIQELERFDGTNTAALYWDAVEARLK